jgi:hypothetical protein
MKVTAQKKLLGIAALIECLTGVAIILVPGIVIALLLGVEANSAALMIARVFGVALLSIGVSCWGATTDGGGPARAGTLKAITLYNAGVGLSLVTYASTGMAHGWLVWIAGALHLGLAAAFAATGYSGNPSSAKPAI